MTSEMSITMNPTTMAIVHNFAEGSCKYASGKSSLNDMNTIMPVTMPNIAPNTSGLQTLLRMAQPTSAPRGSKRPETVAIQNALHLDPCCVVHRNSHGDTLGYIVYCYCKRRCNSD